jgi:predicted small lipoprotein YifL
MIRTTALFACLLLAACGQRGSLYLPDQANPVAVPVTPAPSPAGAAPNDAGSAASEDEQRQRQQQQAAPGNNTGN